MRSDLLSIALLLLSSTPSLAAPQPLSSIPVTDLSTRQDAAVSIESRDLEDLWKRKGGGGGGGKGGSSGSSSGSSGSSSSGSSSSGKGGSSGTGSSGSSSSGGRGSSTSSAGGSTRQGSGAQPSYGGSKGKYYGGGAKSPYKSGGRSPAGIAPVFLGAAALGVFPGLWLYGAYSYPYNHPYSYHNRTARRNTTQTNSTNTRRDRIYSELVYLITRQDDGANETKPVDCLCAEYAVCGCDDNDDSSFLDSLIGDGSYDGLNKSLINVADINGISTIVLNGTLENGTTAAGGTDDVDASTDSGTNTGTNTETDNGSAILQASGYWVMVALVGCSVYLV